MNSLERLQRFKGTAAAEHRASSQSSKSPLKNSSKSPGRGFSPQNLPPIHASVFETPQKVPAHASTRNTSSKNREKDKENLGTEGELLGGEDGQEEALQALASYAAFQLTLLHHFADEPTFTGFSFSDQKQASVSPEKTVHSGRLSEDFVPDDIGMRPEDRSETKMS